MAPQSPHRIRTNGEPDNDLGWRLLRQTTKQRRTGTTTASRQLVDALLADHQAVDRCVSHEVSSQVAHRGVLLAQETTEVVHAHRELKKWGVEQVGSAEGPRCDQPEAAKQQVRSNPEQFGVGLSPDTDAAGQFRQLVQRHPCPRVGAATRPDAVVIEAGASPLEPYNGEACVEMLSPHTRLVVLCASDPYAAHGVISAFGVKPDLITGRAAGTQAGVDLAQRLTGVKVLDLLDPAAKPVLRSLLADRLGLDDPSPR